MIHQYKLNGYNIVLDTCSGSVHAVDDAAYEIISMTDRGFGEDEIISALSGKYEVFKTPGSMNGQIGIPVSLIGLHGEYDVAVIEMGVSLFGEMTRLTNMVHPDMAVFTNIGDAHLEALGDRPGILRAKSEILQGMGPDAVIFANGDDALLSAADFGRKTVCLLYTSPSPRD